MRPTRAAWDGHRPPPSLRRSRRRRAVPALRDSLSIMFCIDAEVPAGSARPTICLAVGRALPAGSRRGIQSRSDQETGISPAAVRPTRAAWDGHRPPPSLRRSRRWRAVPALRDSLSIMFCIDAEVPAGSARSTRQRPYSSGARRPCHEKSRLAPAFCFTRIAQPAYASSWIFALRRLLWRAALFLWIRPRAA